MRCSPAAGCCAAACSAGWFPAGIAPTAISGTGRSVTTTPPALTPMSVKGITEAVDQRFEDRHRRLQFLAIVAVAVARAVVELLGHLRVAGGARIAPVFVKGEA